MNISPHSKKLETLKLTRIRLVREAEEQRRRINQYYEFNTGGVTIDDLVTALQSDHVIPELVDALRSGDADVFLSCCLFAVDRCASNDNKKVVNS